MLVCGMFVDGVHETMKMCDRLLLLGLQQRVNVYRNVCLQQRSETLALVCERNVYIYKSAPGVSVWYVCCWCPRDYEDVRPTDRPTDYNFWAISRV